MIDVKYRCNECHHHMKGSTPDDGACECGGLIESVPTEHFYVIAISSTPINCGNKNDIGDIFFGTIDQFENTFGGLGDNTDIQTKLGYIESCFCFTKTLWQDPVCFTLYIENGNLTPTESYNYQYKGNI